MPVINENDTVATEEIRFGDNDRLAARVAQMIGADTAGAALRHRRPLHRRPAPRPRRAPHPRWCASITPEIEACGGATPAGYGSGGMVTKLVAARIATGRRLPHGDRPRRAASIPCAAHRGRGAAAPGSSPPPEAATARKHWIAGHLSPQGTLVVDDGAARALRKGTSLLPAGRQNGRPAASNAATPSIS